MKENLNNTQQALQGWLNGRLESWKSLESDIERAQRARLGSPDEACRLVQGFRGMGRDLTLARGVMPDSRITQYLDALTVRLHRVIYHPPHNHRAELVQLVAHDVPGIIFDLRRVIINVILLFVGCMLAGWWLISTYPELARLFVSQTMTDKVQQGALWTDDLLNIMPASLLAFSIITNNVTVSLFAYVLGALYGLGTVYIISLNGLMLGAVFAFAGHYDLDVRLFEFVIAHGVVELSVIALAGALGVSLGEALIRPGSRTSVKAFQHAIPQSAKVLLLSIVFLIGAGLIEGYISPDAGISLAVKVAVGVSYGVVFWMTITGWWRKLLLRTPGVITVEVSPGKKARL